jgi:DNA end-binding protein Ku
MAADDVATGELRGRAFWSGTITFGLVSVPVDLYPANRSARVSLRMLGPDGTPLARRYFDPESGRPVDADEIVRGYEVEDGEYVVVTDEELESVEPRKSRDIDLRLFVPIEQLDPVYFERAYFLAPAGESTKAYRLLAETMERTGRAGVATFVMRTREYLIAIIAENGILRAETLRFHDEIRPLEEIELADVSKVKKAEVDRMRRAIEKNVAQRLAVSELEDDYAERLLALVEKKRKQNEDVVEVEDAPDDADDDVIDLMEILKRSMNQARDRRGASKRASKPAGTRKAAKAAPARARTADAPSRKAARTAKGGDLKSLTKEELYERAQQLDVEGRSTMTKAALIRAIRVAE